MWHATASRFLTDYGMQEGYLAKYAVSEEDKAAAEEARLGTSDGPQDPMQGLEELDVAGPKPE